MFKKESRYITRGANEKLDLRLQLILWSMIDKLNEKGKELEYLQVLKIRKCEEGIVIEHSQEVPEYKEKYVIDLENIEVNGNIKVFVIDDYKYSTMINLYKYKQEGVAYRENGLEAKNISFLTYQKVPIEPEEDKSMTGKPEAKEEAQQPQQETPGNEVRPEETENEAEKLMPEPDPVRYRKELKEVSYDVLFDKETKTYVPISAIRKYAYENGINLIDRYKHGYAVRNEDLRECLANPEYRTVRQINKAMRERGYTIERDEAGNYTYIKGESSFFMERRDLLAFTGYAKDTGGRERERGAYRNADKAVGFIGGKAKQKLINEILGDSFRTERMLVGNVKKAVSLIQNPANIKMMLIKQIGSFLNPFKEL